MRQSNNYRVDADFATLSALFSDGGIDHAGKRGIGSGLGRRASPTKKGAQLALEPLNGRGIAGYVPKP